LVEILLRLRLSLKIYRKTQLHNSEVRWPRPGAVFAPPVRARLAARASPRLLDIASSGCLPSCLLRGTTRLPTQVLVVRPIRCTPGAGVPTRGTSYWGHPPRVERPDLTDRQGNGEGARVGGSSALAGVLPKGVGVGVIRPGTSPFWLGAKFLPPLSRSWLFKTEHNLSLFPPQKCRS
jgi:hypothetical protein